MSARTNIIAAAGITVTVIASALTMFWLMYNGGAASRDNLDRLDLEVRLSLEAAETAQQKARTLSAVWPSEHNEATKQYIERLLAFYRYYKPRYTNPKHSWIPTTVDNVRNGDLHLAAQTVKSVELGAIEPMVRFEGQSGLIFRSVVLSCPVALDDPITFAKSEEALLYLCIAIAHGSNGASVGDALSSKHLSLVRVTQAFVPQCSIRDCRSVSVFRARAQHAALLCTAGRRALAAELLTLRHQGARLSFDLLIASILKSIAAEAGEILSGKVVRTSEDVVALAESLCLVRMIYASSSDSVELFLGEPKGWLRLFRWLHDEMKRRTHETSLYYLRPAYDLVVVTAFQLLEEVVCTNVRYLAGGVELDLTAPEFEKLEEINGLRLVTIESASDTLYFDFGNDPKIRGALKDHGVTSRIEVVKLRR